MRGFDLKSAAISLSICAVIALIVSRFSRLPFVAAFLIVLGAIFLNGLVATYEDDIPGGFNNPDGKSTPQYVASVNRVLSSAYLDRAGRRNPRLDDFCQASALTGFASSQLRRDQYRFVNSVGHW